MKIVEFPDGRYAIRRLDWMYFRYEYLDLNCKGPFKIFWPRDSKWFLSECLTKDLDSLKFIMSNGKPI